MRIGTSDSNGCSQATELLANYVYNALLQRGTGLRGHLGRSCLGELIGEDYTGRFAIRVLPIWVRTPMIQNTTGSIAARQFPAPCT